MPCGMRLLASASLPLEVWQTTQPADHPALLDQPHAWPECSSAFLRSGRQSRRCDRSVLTAFTDTGGANASTQEIDAGNTAAKRKAFESGGTSDPPLTKPDTGGTPGPKPDKVGPGLGPDKGGDEPVENENVKQMKEARGSAEAALQRAIRSMSDSRMLHTRIGDLKAERVTSSLRESVENLISDSSNLHDRLQKVDQEHGMLSKAYSRQQGVHGAVKVLSSDVEKATATLDDMQRYIQRFNRRAWALTDIYKAATSQPTLEDIREPPDKPDAAEQDTAVVIKTSAGCQCDPKATCGEHGRDFNWCKVQAPSTALASQDGEEKSCPLYGNPTQTDAAGSDHRVAGASIAETGRPMWDYCRLPPPAEGDEATTAPQNPAVPAHVHRGCQCNTESNKEMLKEYATDPAYRLKTGEFDWSRVPWSDRLGLEAMVVRYKTKAALKDAVPATEDTDEEGPFCVLTPSSGSLHVCPAVNSNQDAGNPQHLGDPGWCGTHKWDFCVPATGKAEDAASQEPTVGTTEPIVPDPNVATPVTRITHPTLGLLASIARQTWSSDVQDARKCSRQRMGLAFL